MAEHLHPLTLQDLCLLEVINDLGSYSMELLSSLPHWLRHRLLNNLPVLDLCRLDHSPLARGVNTDEIWESLPLPSLFYDEKNPGNIPSCIPSGCRVRVPLAHAPFLLEPWVRHGSWFIGRYIVRPSDIPNLDKETAEVFQRIPKQFHSCDYAVVKHGEFPPTDTARKKCLLKAMFHLLDRLEWISSSSKTYMEECKVIFEWFISVATSSTDHNNIIPPPTFEDKNQINLSLSLQNTALTKFQGVDGKIQAAPHRLLPIYSREDPLELFSLLVRDCGLRPSEITLHGLALAQSLRNRFPDEKRRREFYCLLRESLQSVDVLGLWGCTNKCDDTGELDNTCKAIIEGVVGDGTRCRLRVLSCREIIKDNKSVIETLSPYLCTLPCTPGLPGPRYQGLVAFELFTFVRLRDILPHLSALLQQQLLLKVVRIRLNSENNNPVDVHKLLDTLSSLYLRPQFQALSIKVEDPVETRSSLLLVKGFLTAPCAHEQQLTYDTGNRPPYTEISGSKVDVNGSESVPSCAIRHKTLLSHTYDVYRMLLLLPTVKLKDLDLTGKKMFPLALHPDLQLTKLRINLINQTFTDSTEPCEVMKALLKMPTLTELTVYGGWNSAVCLGLACGFEERAKIGHGSLSSISLCTKRNLPLPVTCSGEDFQVLWSALFSLPQLDHLELTISGRYILEAVNSYEREIYESWRRVASGCQLRQIKCAYDVYEIETERDSYEFELLRKISQKYCHLL